MKVTFKLRFHTEYGQSLFLTGNHALLGGGEVEAAVPLGYLNDQFWQVTLEWPEAELEDAQIAYHYVLRQPDGSLIYDWGSDRSIHPASFPARQMLVIDSWNSASFPENTFYTEPFREILLRENRAEVRTQSPAGATHCFRVKAPLLSKDETLCLLGSCETLGYWNTAGPRLLSRQPGVDYLAADVDLSHESFPIQYKYGVYDVRKRAFVRYEAGRNRELDDPVVPGRVARVNDGFAVLPATTWKGAGVAIPVFSLRSRRSFGIGEFEDLKLLADWCAEVGLKLIQILPINDTTASHTWTDSYPYAAISAFALNPVYLDLGQVVAGPNQSLLAGLECTRKRLNALPVVDYEAVARIKLGFLKQIYATQKEDLFQSGDYRKFFEFNRDWLVPYAAFSCLRDQYGTPDWRRWPACGEYRQEEIEALGKPGAPTADGIGLQYFIQYHLHLQLKAASDYVHRRGVVLKGDIPIGVARHGADTWQEPELYRMNAQAGAPPDAFAVKGQNWGFPTYDWPRMQETGYAWWKRRFEQMAYYYDAFRIDHILGFFRIWSIPLDAVEGILGRFVPALPVEAGEFAARGIRLDRDRYLKPWITDSVIEALFAGDAGAVKTRFLIETAPGHYCLRPEYSSQRQVEAAFASEEASVANQRLRDGLYDLISNVILFEAEESGSQRLHFRFAIDSTASFQELDPHTRGQLWDLYVDYFFRRQDALWMKEAMQKLPALKRVTNMLVCGEDLGLVPACVPEVMRQLGLLGLEIQRMPKNPGQTFSRPKDAPYLSVVTPGSHDMSTVRGWWREDAAITQRFFNEELGQTGTAPRECEPWINEAIVSQHLASPAMWSIFQLQDLLGMSPQLRRENPDEERINVPANPKNYWQYRMHVGLEDLLGAESFNGALRAQISRHGR